MIEESAKSIPQPNTYELVGIYIRSELEKVGITVQRICIDILNKNFTVTSETNMPEEIMSSIREYIKNKGFTIEFLS